MLALKGYFNGKEFITLEKAEVKPNQKVIITILDEYIGSDITEDINEKLIAVEQLNGLLNDEGSDKRIQLDEIISKRVNFTQKVEKI